MISLSTEEFTYQIYNMFLERGATGGGGILCIYIRAKRSISKEGELDKFHE